MKKIYALMLMLFCLAMPVEAASKWKLYVNPGHGGFGNNDRQTTMPAVNKVKLPVGSETVAGCYNYKNCFWESVGNTYRALGVKYFWDKRVVPAGGTACKLSRSTNSESGDMTLTAISQASNEYGGYFMSLHTNAGTDNANYMIVMCRSISSSNYGAYSQTSLEMAKKSAYYQGGEGKGLHVTNKTYSTDRGTTDRTFYSGSSLGVLRTNNAPGYLAESWFHDYRPEGFRLCSEKYNYFLAWQIMRAYLDSPGLTGVDLYPIIFGDIRDVTKGNGIEGFSSRGRDKYLALNGVKVTLRNVNTNGTKTMTTDNFNNGFYCFYDCVHGATYEITVEKNGYKTVTKTVTVGTDTKGSQHKLTFDMEEGTNSGISVSPSTLSFGEVTVGSSSSKNITVTGSGLTSAVSISSSNTTDFSLSATSVGTTGGSISVTYKPASAGHHSTTLTLTSGSYKRTMVVDGSAKNPPLTFTEIWNHSETSGKSETWSATKSKIRNFTYGNGKLYVVNAEDSKIYVVDARTGKLKNELNMTGVTGGTLSVMDVKCVDGKLVATNLASTAEGGDATLKIYVWDNDDDKTAPRVILNTTNLGGYGRVGDTFSIKGNLTNGTICYAACDNANPNADGAASYILSYAITGGTVSTAPTSISLSDGEEKFSLGLSPRVIAEEGGNYWVIGQSYYPTVVDPAGGLLGTVTGEALGNEVAGNAFAQFVFKGTQYAFATTYTSASAATDRLKDGRAVLMDCTGGWANAENIGEYPAAGLGSTRNTSMSGNIEVAVNGNNGVEMWILVHNQGIAYYRHGTIEDDGNDDDDNTGDDNTGTPAVPGNVTAMKEVWNYSLNGTKPSYLDLADNYVRSIAFNDGKLYVLQNKGWAAPEIDIIDAYTGVHKGNLSVDGVQSATIYVSSLVAVDGKILGAPAVTASQVLRVYQWDNDASAPKVILEDATHAGETMGAKMSFSGDMTNGKIWFTNDKVSKAIYYTVTNGVVNTTANVINLTDGGEAFAGEGSRGPAAVEVNSDGTFWVVGTGQYPTYFNASGVKQAVMQAGALGNVPGGTDMKQFYYNGNQYVAATTYAEKLANGKFVIVDANNGPATASNYLAMYPSAGLGSTTNAQGVNTIVVDVREDGAVLDIWVCVSQQGVAYYSCGTPAVPGTPSAIENVEIEEVDAPVEYYNLQGMRVNAENLRRGIYIKRQGKKTSKIFVR